MPSVNIESWQLKSRQGGEKRFGLAGVQIIRVNEIFNFPGKLLKNV